MADLPSRRGVDDLNVRLDRQDPYLRIQAVNIFVRDQERSLRFYLDQLGFHLVGDIRVASGERWVAVSPPDGTAVLSLTQAKPDSPEYEWIGRPTQVVFITEDVMSKFKEWRKRGVRFQRAPRLKRFKYPEGKSDRPVWGGVFARFEDIDGNCFSLVGFDEVSQAVEAQRRVTAERLEADRRAAQEIEIARRVQSRLFPQTLPSASTLEYAGSCIQARQVGGDYYDFLDLGQGRLGLVIGDISGKGIAAALLMANLQANLRSQCATALDQSQRFLQSVNRLFYDNTGQSAFASLFFGEYDDRERRLRYANCGHLSGLLLRADNTLERLDSTGTVLGLFPDWHCSVEEQRLFPGDTLTLYTDGISEAFNAAREEYGEKRLVDTLRRHRDRPSGDLLQAILADVQDFSPHEQHDDITLIVAKCKEG